MRIDNNLDFLSLTDPQGFVVVRARYPYNSGDDESNDALVSRALGGESVAGTQILHQENLNQEGEGLAEQAFMVFVKPLGPHHVPGIVNGWYDY